MALQNNYSSGFAAQLFTQFYGKCGSKRPRGEAGEEGGISCDCGCMQNSASAGDPATFWRGARARERVNWTRRIRGSETEGRAGERKSSRL